MIIDTNFILTFLVILTWVFFLSVMFFPEKSDETKDRSEDVSDENEECEFSNEINEPENVSDIGVVIIDENEKEISEDKTLETIEEVTIADKNDNDIEFFNNDVSGIFPVNGSGILYTDENKAFKSFILDKPLKSFYDNRLYVDGEMKDRQFLKPIKHNSSDISSFYKFFAFAKLYCDITIIFNIKYA